MYRNHEYYIDWIAGGTVRRADRQRKGYTHNEYPWGTRLTYRIGEVMDPELMIRT